MATNGGFMRFTPSEISQDDYAVPHEYLATEEGQAAVARTQIRQNQREAFEGLRALDEALGLDDDVEEKRVDESPVVPVVGQLVLF